MSRNISETTCRVCLNEQNSTRSIYDEVKCFHSKFCELLEYCGDMKIDENDSYPKVICEDCVSELIVATTFREKCKRTTEILSQIVTTEVIEEEFDEEIDESIVPDDIKKEVVEFVSNTDDIIDASSIQRWKISKEGDIYEQVEFLDHSDSSQNFIVFGSDDEEVKVDIDEDVDIISNMNYEEADIEESNESYNNSQDGILDESETKESVLYELQYSTNFSDDRVSEQDSAKVKSSAMNCNCDICGAGFIHFYNLRKHLLTHQPKEVFTCLYCGSPFTKLNLFNEHVSAHQSKGEKLMEENIDEEISVIIPKKSTDGEMKKLKRNHHCEQCDKSFVSKSALNAHMRIHTGDRPFECSQCFKTFTTQGGLDLHMRRHAGHKPFSCEICNKKFVESSNLKVHMRMHTGEKPHKCITCERSFARVFLLKLHQRTHTGERPYHCPFCQKAFAQQGDLAAHKRIHTGERPHKCPYCLKGFIKSSGLTSHLRRHAKFFNQKKPIVKVQENEIESDDKEKVHVELVFVDENQQESNDSQIALKDIVLINE